jgi:hypothetical protein
LHKNKSERREEMGFSRMEIAEWMGRRRRHPVNFLRTLMLYFYLPHNPGQIQKLYWCGE